MGWTRVSRAAKGLPAIATGHMYTPSLPELTMTAAQGFIVTKRGKVDAGLTPPDDPTSAAQSLHGFLRGLVVTPPGLDLTAPTVDGVLLANEGRLHG